MIDLDPRNQNEARCPKRLWVMLTLSDDELIEGADSVPLGLRVHLAQCDSCRALSHRLLDVSDGLQTLGTDEPPAGLLREANAGLKSALAAVPVPPSGPADNDSRISRGVLGCGKSARGIGVLRYAAAAVIAVGLFLPVLRYGGGTGAGAARRGQSVGGVPGTWRSEVGPAKDISSVAAEPKTRSPGPDDVPGASETRPGLAEADAPAAGQRDRKPRICTFDAYGSPAGPDDANCIYRGFQLPRRGEPPRKRR